ncbi:MAG TPA: hypothetical protein VMK32_03665 [Burkholderiaceae bacterium]|nr:hypothetical protein [Burkholderiaceae bacterium]
MKLLVAGVALAAVFAVALFGVSRSRRRRIGADGDAGANFVPTIDVGSHGHHDSGHADGGASDGGADGGSH